MKLNYKKIWENSTVPKEYNEMFGDFNVKVLTGPFKVLNRIFKSWEKHIPSEDLNANYIDGKEQGFFFLAKHVDSEEEIFCLDYNNKYNNGTYWLRMRDLIRMSEPDVFIGKIYIRIFRKDYRFVGYFSLVSKGVNFDEETFKILKPEL